MLCTQVEKGGGTGIINMGSKAGIEPVPGQVRSPHGPQLPSGPRQCRPLMSSRNTGECDGCRTLVCKELL